MPFRFTGVGAQVVLALLSAPALALMPPAQGAMLVVPLRPASQARLINLALEQDGRVLGAGPIGNSVVVLGRRAPMVRAFRRVGAIVLAAPVLLCDVPSAPVRP